MVGELGCFLSFQQTHEAYSEKQHLLKVLFVNYKHVSLSFLNTSLSSHLSCPRQSLSQSCINHSQALANFQKIKILKQVNRQISIYHRIANVSPAPSPWMLTTGEGCSLASLPLQSPKLPLIFFQLRAAGVKEKEPKRTFFKKIIIKCIGVS